MHSTPPAYARGAQRKEAMRTTLLSLLCLCLLALVATADDHPVPLERAHSHNDYFHKRPLLDALDAGFCSVEADIHLVDGQLLVAHDRDKVSPEATLAKLYLDPLLDRVRKNGGRAYPNGPTVTLLIDFKSNGEKTYPVLCELLKDYAEMLTVFTDDSTEPKAVSVIISGSRPIDTIAKESPRLVAVDGRLPDLYGGKSPHLMPLVSSSWDTAFSWDGKGEMPKDQRAKLDKFVTKAHAQGRRIRFWGLPVREAVWPTLYDAGVDLLNADNLEALRDLLIERMPEKPAQQ